MAGPIAQLTIAREFIIRRSELTCPGHSSKMMAKAAASRADEVILDLEDAVAMSQKTTARASVIEALRTLDFGNSVRAFRINGLRTNWGHDDLREVIAAVGERVQVVVLPKVESADEVREVDAQLTELERARGIETGSIRIEALIESARGLLDAASIARASARMDSLIFGIADYAGDIGARSFADQPYAAFHYPRAHILAAARAAGIAAIDAVTVQFKELSRVTSDSRDAAQLGFDGKWAIHPAQLAPIHEAFTPSREEIDRARKIIQAYASADTAEGRGAIVLDDEMVDAASLRVEWKKLRIAQKAGLLNDDFSWR